MFPALIHEGIVETPFVGRCHEQVSSRVLCLSGNHARLRSGLDLIHQTEDSNTARTLCWRFFITHEQSNII